MLAGELGGDLGQVGGPSAVQELERFEGLKRYAHANQWGRESVRQWAEEGLMDDAPEVVALLEQWPLRYKDLEAGAWPAALLPENPG